MTDRDSLWTRTKRWLKPPRIRELSQEQYLKRIWAVFLILGVLSISVDLWRDGIILVKGAPVLTTLRATILAVTLSSMLSWRVQVAWHEKTELNRPPDSEAPRQGHGQPSQ